MTSDKLKLSKIKGNIIAVEIDPELDDTQIEAIKSKVYERDPLEVKFTILRDTYGLDNDVKYTSNVDIVDIMMHFVDELKLEDITDDVKVKLKELYDQYLYYLYELQCLSPFDI